MCDTTNERQAELCWRCGATDRQWSRCDKCQGIFGYVVEYGEPTADAVSFLEYYEISNETEYETDYGTGAITRLLNR
jgi:hypothetical protein